MSTDTHFVRVQFGAVEAPWIPTHPTDIIDAEARRLFASVYPEEVKHGMDLRILWRKRLRRRRARRDSGPGRREARAA